MTARRCTRRWTPRIRRAARLLPLLALAAGTAALAQGPRCLPSCGAADGRFLVVTPGKNLETLSDETLDLELSVAAAAADFTLGFFDGDLSVPPAGHWDVCFRCGQAWTEYRLYADPLVDGTGDVLVATFDSSQMADNGWTDFTIANVEAARAENRQFYYRLEIELMTDPSGDPRAAHRNSLKVRSSDLLMIKSFQQPFAFIAAMTGPQDAALLYEDFDLADLPGTLAGATGYDGTFTFYLDQNDPLDEDTDLDFLALWDGDLDFGKFDCSEMDTDDPNSPAFPDSDPFPFHNPAVMSRFAAPDNGEAPAAERVAEGTLACPGGESAGRATGAPADDADGNALGGIGGLFLRQPSIHYTVHRVRQDLTTEPIAENRDPSGNKEWEKFRIDRQPGVDPDGPEDALVPDLSEGVYEVRLAGLDLENLNALFLGPILCLEEDGDPCEPDIPETCGPCEGKVSSLRMRYLGAADAQITVIQKRSGVTVFDAPVEAGNWFEFTGTENGSLGPEIHLLIDGRLNVEIHTSCSQEIGSGFIFGDFLVLGGSSRRGGPLCPFEGDEPAPSEAPADESPGKGKKNGQR